MRRLQLRTGAIAGAIVALATMMVSLGTAVITAAPAGAEPTYATALVGVGSDTIQDLFNAFQGAAPFPVSTQAAKFYIPLHSSDASGDRTLVSWDAVDPATGVSGCLVQGAKPGFAQIDRPNGSGAGMNALSDANDGHAFAPTTNCGQTSASANDVTGQIDFARSSSGPNPVNFPGTQLTFIPFARDGVSFAFYSPLQADKGLADVGTLTSGQLQSLYGTGSVPSTGSITLGNGHTVKACMVQGGSGTGKFWDKAMGNDGTGATAAASAVASGCNASPNPPIEENGGNAFISAPFVSALTATQVAVIPFSVGSWVAQANAVALDRSATARSSGANLGQIDALGAPYTGTPGTEVPSDTFYASTTYGRDLYVIVPTSKLGPPAGANAALKTVFTNLIAGSPAAICSAAAGVTIKAFGFTTTLAAGHTCGMTTLTQGFTQ